MQFVNNNVSLVNYISCQCRWPHGPSSPLMQYTRSRAPGPGGKVTSTSRGWRWVGLGICKVGEVGSVILDTISPTGSHVLQSLLPTSLPVDLYGPLYMKSSFPKRDKRQIYAKKRQKMNSSCHFAVYWTYSLLHQCFMPNRYISLFKMYCKMQFFSKPL